MLFNTFEYLAFYVTVFSLAWLMRERFRVRLCLLLVASLIFYTTNNRWQVLLIIFTTTVDYSICLAMEKKPRHRKLLLLLSLLSNLGLLGYFKYMDFAGQTAQALASLLGWELAWVDQHVLLPVGISFYTFEALSYTIDVYRGHIKAEKRWDRLLFLVSFFPHLIAGPIVRPADFFPQMDRPPSLRIQDVNSSLLLIIAGLVKKVVLADSLSSYVDVAFSGTASPLGTVAGVYAFALQIYFDFSGYTDLALGSARLLGFELPENFRNPYAATSIADFWRRWHISLSTWLRDYLYIPLGGNAMRTSWGVRRNLMLTMLLGGLWHGAAWNFVLWGGLHGVRLSARRLRGQPKAHRPPTPWRALWVFHLVALLWVLFRVDSLESLGIMGAAIVSHPILTGATLAHVAIIVFACAVCLLHVRNERQPWKETFARLPAPAQAAAYGAAMFAILVFNSTSNNVFIYFQF